MLCSGAGTVQLGTCPTVALHPAAPALSNNGSQEVICWLQDCEKVRNPSSPFAPQHFLNYFLVHFITKCLLKGSIALYMRVQLNPCSRAADTQTEMWWTTMTWVHSSKLKTCAHLAWITQPQHMKLWVFPRTSRILHKCRGGTYV